MVTQSEILLATRRRILRGRHYDNEGMIIPKKLSKAPNQLAHQIAKMITDGPESDEVVTDL